MRRILMPIAFVPLVLAGPALAQPPAYHVVKTVKLGAPDRWDYVVVDPVSHRVYVAHGDIVSVVDSQTGAILGKVEGLKGGSHGIGIVASVGRGYTDDGQAGVAVPFDLKTYKTGAPVKAMDDADGIAFDPVSGHIYVVDGDSKTLTVIDPKTNTAIATVDAGGGLEYAVSGDNGKLYVNGAENKEIVRIDTATNKVDAHWPMPGCTSPHGLAIDRANHRLFPTCANGVMEIVNTDNGKVVATLPIGQGTDGAAFDPKRKLIFSSNYDGTVSMVHEKDPNTFVPAGSIKTQVTGKNMGIDPDTGRLYVVVADIDSKAPVPKGPNGRPGRARPIPGSVKLLFLDPGA